MVEEEEDEAEADKHFKARQEMNSRTWSHESKVEDDTIRVGSFNHHVNSIVDNTNKSIDDGKKASDIDSDLAADGFFFYDETKEVAPPVQSPRYSPPPKRTSFDKPIDKWAKLGERRRAYTSTSESEKSPDLWRTGRRNVGLGFTGFGNGVWDMKANSLAVKDTGANRDFKGNRCPWARDKARSYKQQRWGDGDLEWVGGSFDKDLHL